MNKKSYCCLILKPFYEFYNKETICKDCFKTNQNESYTVIPPKSVQCKFRQNRSA